MSQSGKKASALAQVVAKRRELDDAVRRARNGDTGAAASITRLAEAYAKAARAAGVYGQSLADIIRRQREFAGEAARSGRMAGALQTLQAGRSGLTAASDTRKNAISGAMADVGAIIGMAAPLKTGAEFEVAMSKVGAISGAAGQAFDALAAKARELGATTTWSAKEAAEGMQFLSMAGFKTNEVLAAMPGMLSLASAGAMDLGATADIASNILSGFGMEASKMGYVGDVLAKTFTSSNTSIASLGESFKYAAPVAKAAGQSFQDVAAMIGKLGDAGIQGSMAGTGLSAIIGRLAKPPKEAAEALGKLGVKVADAKGNLRALPDVFADIEKKMGRFSEAQRVALAKALYGAEHFGKGMVLQAVAVDGSLQKMSAGLNELGYADMIAARQNDNLIGDLKSLNSAYEEVGICLYNVMQPALRTVIQGILPIVRTTGEWINENPRLVQGLTMLGGAFMSLKIGALAFTLLNSYRRTFSAGLLTMRGAAQVGIAGVLNSFGRLRMELARPVNISTASFTAGTARMRQGLASLRASVSKTALACQNLSLASVNAGARAALAGAKAAASGAMAATGRAGWNMLRLGIKGVGIAFKTALGPVSLITTALTFGVEAIIERWDRIEPYFVALWQGVKNVFTTVLDWITPIFEKITSFISPIIDGVKTIGGAIGKGVSWFGEKWDGFWGNNPDQKAPVEQRVAVEPPAQAAVKTVAQARTAQSIPELEKQTQGAQAAQKPEPAAQKPAQPAKPDAQIIQPQVSVAVNVTQNGIPEQSFASGVMSAIRARQSELENIISGIVNEQARLAYGA